MKQPQIIMIPVRFTAHHSPGNDLHLKEVIRNYLTSKGVEFNGVEIVI